MKKNGFFHEMPIGVICGLHLNTEFYPAEHQTRINQDFRKKTIKPLNRFLEVFTVFHGIRY